MPASELYLWIAYDQASPIGDERSDIHSAQIASSVFQSQGAKVTTSDMIIKWKVTEQDETKDAHDFFKSIQKAQRNG